MLSSIGHATAAPFTVSTRPARVSRGRPVDRRSITPASRAREKQTRSYSVPAAVPCRVVHRAPRRAPPALAMPAAGAALAPSYGAVGAGRPRARRGSRVPRARARRALHRPSRTLPGRLRSPARRRARSLVVANAPVVDGGASPSPRSPRSSASRAAHRAEPDAFGASPGPPSPTTTTPSSRTSPAPPGAMVRSPPGGGTAPPAGDRLNDHAPLFKIAWFPVFRGEFVEDQATLPTHVRDELGHRRRAALHRRWRVRRRVRR